MQSKPTWKSEKTGVGRDDERSHFMYQSAKMRHKAIQISMPKHHMAALDLIGSLAESTGCENVYADRHQCLSELLMMNGIPASSDPGYFKQ